MNMLLTVPWHGLVPSGRHNRTLASAFGGAFPVRPRAGLSGAHSPGPARPYARTATDGESATHAGRRGSQSRPHAYFDFTAGAADSALNRTDHRLRAVQQPSG